MNYRLVNHEKVVELDNTLFYMTRAHWVVDEGTPNERVLFTTTKYIEDDRFMPILKGDITNDIVADYLKRMEGALLEKISASELSSHFLG